MERRRYKTDEYNSYERALLDILPKEEIPIGNLKIEIIFGFSSKGSDWDNPIKPFQDVLSKKYGVNDNRIYEAHIKKEIVKKGEEYIKYKITAINSVL